MLVAPHSAGQAVDGDHPAGVEEQGGQYRPLLGAAELDRPAVPDDLDRPEQAVVRHAPHDAVFAAPARGMRDQDRARDCTRPAAARTGCEAAIRARGS